uniref:Uncharacterized protein n=1 Tax=Triticum urartu TaxID=4572 RepID=A0A8R7QB51_TRIUA
EEAVIHPRAGCACDLDCEEVLVPPATSVCSCYSTFLLPPTEFKRWKIGVAAHRIPPLHPPRRQDVPGIRTSRSTSGSRCCHGTASIWTRKSR